MRELKFRVWYENVKRGEKKGDEIVWHTESYYGYSPVIDNEGLLEVEGGWDICGNSDENYVIEQYTGLKDKNGKEIYEGDIIRCHGDDRFIAPVIRHEKSGGFCWVSCYKEECFIPESDEVEVIGNIHENKELLEGGK